ncbi:hypothetical protein ACGFZP_13380 [Kitasatospora sp. NPDC048239]|uniref:hypothetical protein n=1 Tax=Kitasatospora sp. NPDC048239 TaxID=3364046 RepID=UPI00371358A7
MPTVTTRRKMGPIALTFHTIMMVCTLGLWTPVLMAAKRGRKTVTRYDGIPPMQPGQQPYGPPPGQYPPPPYGQQPHPPQQQRQQPGPPPPASWGRPPQH